MMKYRRKGIVNAFQFTKDVYTKTAKWPKWLLEFLNDDPDDPTIWFCVEDEDIVFNEYKNGLVTTHYLIEDDWLVLDQFDNLRLYKPNEFNDIFEEVS